MDSQLYNTRRWQLTLKTAIAVCLCSAITLAFHWTNLSFIAPISAIVILLLFQHETIKASIERILGPLIFSCVALLILYYCHYTLINSILIAILLFVGSYLFASGFFPYAALMGTIISAVVFSLGANNLPLGFITAKSFVLECALGVVIAYLVNGLLWPPNKKQVLTALALQVEKLIESYKTQTETITLEDFTHCKLLLLSANSNMSATQRLIYENLIINLKFLLLKIRHLNQQKSDIGLEKNLPALNPLLVQFNKKVVLCLKKLSHAMREQKPLKFKFAVFTDITHEIQAKLNELRKNGNLLNIDVLDALKMTNFLNSSLRLRFRLENLAEDYNALFTNKPTQKLLHFIQQPKAQLWPPKPIALKRAFKLSLSLFIVYLLATYWDYWGGIQAVITAGIIVAQANSGRSRLKLSLRFLGILAGGLNALLFLFLLGIIPSKLFLLVLLFISTGVYSYIALGSDRIAYFGLQASIMLVLVLLSARGINTGISRFDGVISGGIIGFLVALLIFPEHPKKQLQAQFKIGLMYCSTMLIELVRKSHIANLSEKEAKCFANIYQLLRDAGDSGSPAIEKHYFILFSLLQDCFAQLTQMDALSAAFARSELCQQAYRDLKQVHLKLPRLFEWLANHLNDDLSKRVEAEILLKKLSAIVQSYRDKKITLQYPLEEVALYTTMVSGTIFLLQRIILMKQQLSNAI